MPRATSECAPEDGDRAGCAASAPTSARILHPFIGHPSLRSAARSRQHDVDFFAVHYCTPFPLLLESHQFLAICSEIPVSYRARCSLRIRSAVLQPRRAVMRFRAPRVFAAVLAVAVAASSFGQGFHRCLRRAFLGPGGLLPGPPVTLINESYQLPPSTA